MRKKNDSRHASRPIGVFDSGLGGLTIVREIRRALPQESIVYFGDMARLPYGTKSREQILAYSIQNTLFLIKHKVKAVVIACNSSSSAAFSFLKRHFTLPILDVIEPAAEQAHSETRSGRIGLIATRATVASGAYDKALKKRNPRLSVFGASCPLFVPLAEEGWFAGEIPEAAARVYLRPLLKKKIDTLILGCTHYPLLKSTIRKAAGPSVRLVDSIAPTVRKLTALLDKKGLRNRGGRGALKIFVSDKPGNFVVLGESFLGEKLKHVKVVRPK